MIPISIRKKYKTKRQQLIINENCYQGNVKQYYVFMWLTNFHRIEINTLVCVPMQLHEYFTLLMITTRDKVNKNIRTIAFVNELLSPFVSHISLNTFSPCLTDGTSIKSTVSFSYALKILFTSVILELLPSVFTFCALGDSLTISLEILFTGRKRRKKSIKN